MLRGYVARSMQRFDYDRARTEFPVPDEYQVEAMVAVGMPGGKDSLPERLQTKETPNERRPLAQSVCEGPFHL